MRVFLIGNEVIGNFYKINSEYIKLRSFSVNLHKIIEFLSCTGVII